MYRLSRSRLELFIECPRCFYLWAKFNIDRPAGFPFTINSAIDELLKKEFDQYRKEQKIAPLIRKLNIRAVPFQHEKIDTWRNPRVGIGFYDINSGIYLYGAVDDLWINDHKKIHVVDYKATGSIDHGKERIRSEHARQLEIYQYLLEKNGLPVDKTAFLLQFRVKREAGFSENKLSFSVQLWSHKGNWKWIERELKAISLLLKEDTLPLNSPGCPYCDYFINRQLKAGERQTELLGYQQEKLF